jgi:hypothetical protein
MTTENTENQQEVAESNFMDKINDYFISIQSVKVKDKLIFYRLLATMTNA